MEPINFDYSVGTVVDVITAPTRAERKFLGLKKAPTAAVIDFGAYKKVFSSAQVISYTMV